MPGGGDPRQPPVPPERQLPQMVDEAADLTRYILAADPERLRHSEAVARRAEFLTLAVTSDQAPFLVAVAWLHDIGNAPGLRQTGFHPIDGALHLRSAGWPDAMCDLVAHHSGSRFVAAAIRATLTLTENGEPLGVDGEGIAARRDGGFWIAAEGDDEERVNEIILTGDDAAVLRRIPLPAEIADVIGSRGLEGIAVTGTGSREQVFVALQSPLSSDPPGVTRIGRYHVASGIWTWYGYPLDAGSNVGLSEIVALGGNRFAVLERDNLPGPTAAVKRIYTVDLDEVSGSGLPLLTKTLVRDLLPDLRATNGWVQEKVEGLTVGGDGRVTWSATTTASRTLRARRSLPTSARPGRRSAGADGVLGAGPTEGTAVPPEVR